MYCVSLSGYQVKITIKFAKTKLTEHFICGDKRDAILRNCTVCVSCLFFAICLGEQTLNDTCVTSPVDFVRFVKNRKYS